jgi:hypothetical protein
MGMSKVQCSKKGPAILAEYDFPREIRGEYAKRHVEGVLDPHFWNNSKASESGLIGP